jgi:hypothetical protein
MKTSRRIQLLLVAVLSAICVALILVSPQTEAQQPQSSGQRPSSYMSVNEEPFDVVRARDKANKAGLMAAHQRLLAERYNLARHVDENVRMTRGKPIPVGPTAKLKNGVTWEQLGRMSPDEIRRRGYSLICRCHTSSIQSAAWSSRRQKSSLCLDSNGLIWTSICQTSFCRNFRRQCF